MLDHHWCASVPHLVDSHSRGVDRDVQGGDHSVRSRTGAATDIERGWPSAGSRSRSGPAALLVRSAPERVVWGTDFPHPNTCGFVPDDGDLVDLLSLIAPDPADLRLVLVDNPTACFDFR